MFTVRSRDRPPPPFARRSRASRWSRSPTGCGVASRPRQPRSRRSRRRTRSVSRRPHAINATRLAPERRAESARSFLARHAGALAADERAQIAAETLAILDDPRFAALFAPGSYAEAPIVGRVAINGGPPLPVSGQVDRLAVTPDCVLIADYKTNRPAPRRLADIPPAYVAQLALYRAVLAKLYPERTVRAALVFTDGPHLIELPAEALAAALGQLTSA